MEKLPTIILPGGYSFEELGATPRHRTRGSLIIGKQKTPRAVPLLQLGGVRLRCYRPQNLAEDFYTKRLGMQEMFLNPDTCTGEGKDGLEFRLMFPDRPTAYQISHPPSPRPRRDESRHADKNLIYNEYSCRADVSSTAGNKTEGAAEMRRFLAYDFFTREEIDKICAASQGCEPGPTETLNNRRSWLRRGFSQFVLEFDTVAKDADGAYRRYKHSEMDCFSRLAFRVSDVDEAAVHLSQFMVRVQPAGQLPGLAYSAGFVDPQNFRGLLLQYLSEYTMVSWRAALNAAKQSKIHSIPSSETISCTKTAKHDVEVTQSQDASTIKGQAINTISQMSTPRNMECHQAELEGCLHTLSAEEIKAIGSANPNMLREYFDLPASIRAVPRVLHHVELRCSEAASMLQFYEKVVGMTLIDIVDNDSRFVLYFMAFEAPKQTTLREWIWLQPCSCICIKECFDRGYVNPYQDIGPDESGFLGISFLCNENNEGRLLHHLTSNDVLHEYVNDDFYGRKVLLLRDPQNTPVRIVMTS